MLRSDSMKVLFKTEGGFGYFPGLNKPMELDSEALPEEEAEHLKQLLNENDFFNLPNQELETVRGADMKTYLIQVKEEAIEHWVQVSENNMEPRMQKLVNYLNNKRRGEGN